MFITSMKKGLTISMLFLGVIFLAGCGQQPTAQMQPTKPAPVVQTPNPAGTKAADYQTYKNDQYGFEVQLPKNWEIDAERTGANEFIFLDRNKAAGESRESISAEPNSKKLVLDQAVNEFMTERGYAEQQIKRDFQIKVGGEKTVQIETNEFGLTLYMFIHQGTIFTIETQGLFTDDVLKTFKFTK